ncbi:MAG: cupredoxin domain-containing protein [Alphaproteobacteria bacterium]
MRLFGAGIVALGLAAALAPGGSAVAADHVVSMNSETYSPKLLKAKVGDRLVFDNDDTEDHAVFVPTVGFGVDLGGQKPGEKRSLPLRRAGTFDVECVLHENMKMTVEVAR